MRLELHATNTVGALDVSKHKTIAIQCRPGGVDLSSAVVEVRRAFDGRTDSPSVAFSSTVTLTLDGSGITEIDVTDVAWIHFVCTTAVSGASVEIDYKLTGEMDGDVTILTVNADAVGLRGFTAARYKAMVLAQPDTTVTGAFEIKQSVGAGMQAVSFSPAASLTLDGSTITEIDTEAAGVLHAACTTAQSGLGVTLYMYLRDEVPEDSASSGGGGGGIDTGTSFPGSPSDGDAFIRTDLDGNEIFIYDSTRGKWLGQEQVWTFSRNSAASSGQMSMNFEGSVLTGTARGVLMPRKLTITGIEVYNQNSGITCDFDIFEGGTKLTTLLSFSSDKYGSDHTLNYDMSVTAGSQRNVRAQNFSAGTLSNPIVRIFLRRRET